VWWYRSWWLANISTDDAGRPPLPAPNTSTFVHIVESWQAPAPGMPGRTINIYSNAPSVRLSVNGAEVGTADVAPYTAATFSNVTYEPGAVSADALDSSGTVVLATTQKKSWGAPAALMLSIDTPSLSAGTGAAVYLDGQVRCSSCMALVVREVHLRCNPILQDVALIRCTVVDEAGAVVSSGSINVTFSVSAGPGYFWASHNGDPACQEPSHSPTKSTCESIAKEKSSSTPHRFPAGTLPRSDHGLVRGIVRPSLRATGSSTLRALEALLNPEAGKGPDSATIVQGDVPPAAFFTVTATAPGLPPASINVPLSVDPSDAVLAVAAASVGSAYIGE